jgi:hypothetical protein
VKNPADKQRIKIIATEVNAVDFGNEGWANNNDVGHALVAFDIIGKQITYRQVDMAFFWNTRWVDNVNKPHHAFDALGPNGNLQANGLALSIWGNYLLDRLVSVNSTDRIVTYASRNKKDLHVFLINKDTVSHQVNLALQNFKLTGLLKSHVFAGKSITDINPVIEPFADLSYVSGGENIRFSLQAKPASITILRFTQRFYFTQLPIEFWAFSLLVLLILYQIYVQFFRTRKFFPSKSA